MYLAMANLNTLPESLRHPRWLHNDPNVTEELLKLFEQVRTHALAKKLAPVDLFYFERYTGRPATKTLQQMLRRADANDAYKREEQQRVEHEALVAKIRHEFLEHKGIDTWEQYVAHVEREVEEERKRSERELLKEIHEYQDKHSELGRRIVHLEHQQAELNRRMSTARARIAELKHKARSEKTKRLSWQYLRDENGRMDKEHEEPLSLSSDDVMEISPSEQVNRERAREADMKRRVQEEQAQRVKRARGEEQEVQQAPAAQAASSSASPDSPEGSLPVPIDWHDAVYQQNDATQPASEN
jgi:hypothetical protein